MTAFTEKEAFQKWCPKTFNGGAGSCCIGSSCMAWRWIGPAPDRRFIYHDPQKESAAQPERPPRIPASWEWMPYEPEFCEPACWIEPQEEADARRRGYCGAFGKPDGTVRDEN